MFINHDVAQKVYNNIYEEKIPKFFGCIEIGNNVFIGARAIILPNVKICDNVYIAAGAVVTKSIEVSGIWGGIPAKLIGDFDSLYLNRIEYNKNIFKKDKNQYHNQLWEQFSKQNK